MNDHEAVARRDFLKQLSAASAAALACGGTRVWADTESVVHPAAKADSCIVIWLAGGMAAPDLGKMMAGPDGEPVTEFEVPQPRIPREDQQEQYTRDIEIDPHKYYPPDVYREPLTKLPDPMVMKLPPRK